MPLDTKTPPAGRPADFAFSTGFPLAEDATPYRKLDISG